MRLSASARQSLCEGDALEGEIVRLGPPIRREGFGYFLVYRVDALDRPAARAIRDHLTGGAPQSDGGGPAKRGEGAS